MFMLSVVWFGITLYKNSSETEQLHGGAKKIKYLAVGEKPVKLLT